MIKRLLLVVVLTAVGATAASAGLFTKYFERKDDEQCRAYGTLPGTDAYVNCRLALHQRRLQALDDFSTQLQYQNQLQQQRNFQQQLLLQQNQPRRCTSRVYGNTIQTNCF